MLTQTVPTIRQVTTHDLIDVVAVHAAAFPEQALTLMGADTLIRYYEVLLNPPNRSSCIGAFIHGELRGYVLAGIFHTTLLGFLRRNLAFLTILFLRRPHIFLRAIVMSRFFTALRVMPRLIASEIRPSRRAEPDFRVQVLGVHPANRRFGLGRLLMAACEAEARSMGFQKIGLSVHRQNREAVCFYEALGWQRRFVNGEWTTEMTRELPTR
jgi:ribosomal protein S18 acetylase RimI-like enzyme